MENLQQLKNVGNVDFVELKESGFSSFYDVAKRTLVTSDIKKQFLTLIGEDPLSVDKISLKDITSFYVTAWHEMNMSEKKMKADAFTQVHEWVMKISGLYKINPSRIIYRPISENFCRTCNGTGLFIKQTEDKYITKCPGCMGSGMKTSTCSRCNGIGCSSCKNNGYYIYSSTSTKKGIPCEICGIDSPFGKLKGKGFIMRPVKVNVEKLICQKCQGSGKVK